MAVENKTDPIDDEEDLEALRLAALSSLKKKNEANEVKTKKEFTSLPYNNYKGSFKGGKRRFFPGQSHRGNRNGQFNNQVRNTNLISIPTSTECSDKTELRSSKFASKSDDPPKLILPQDRYANATTQEVETDGPSSKFDRYNNSNSESEEDDEISDSKLERCDSLEALMEELDAEILGEPVKERKAKVKKESKVVEDTKEEEKIDNKNKIEEEKIDNEKKIEEDVQEKDKEITKCTSEEVIVHSESESKDVSKSPSTEAEVSSECSSKVDKVEQEKKIVDTNKPQLQRSPNQRKVVQRRMNNGRVFKPLPPVNNPIIIPNQPYMNPLHTPQFTTVYNTVPSYSIPEVFPMNIPPPYIPPPSLPPCIIPQPPLGYNMPPLQPLVIDPPGPMSSTTMGQLSPRSAAFVLQNRAIVEKRKRSPRRSFSRSPSPLHHRPRYSKSPGSGRSHSPLRRSLSPSRRPFSPLPRSNSPRRSPTRRSLSPYRRNKSPRRESPRRSPRRTRISPKRSPKRTRESPKRIKESRRTPIKDRLGNRGKNEDKEPAKKEEPTTSSPKIVDSKPLDPVLEARKKKFESKEINVKEKVIRLKPKEEPVTKVKEEITPPRPKVVELPKTKPTEKTQEDVVKPRPVVEKSKSPARTPPKQETSTRIVLLPKNETKIPAQTKTLEEPQGDQLEDAINELEMLLKDDEALELTAKVDELFTDEETDQENEAKRFAATGENENPVRKVANGASKPSSEKKREPKSKWKFEEAKKEAKKIKKEPLTNPIENRKIEIKIRNPSKYEKNGSKGSQGSVQSSSGRTVELTKKESFSEDESEPEIIVEEEEEVEEVTTSREGDLRAQLSRKRAERQNKLPPVEGVQSRLLQSALEGAVFKKKKSKKKDKEPKDVKLPIHLRLGIAHDSDVFAESILTEKISRKKSKKRKHADMEQV